MVAAPKSVDLKELLQEGQLNLAIPFSKISLAIVTWGLIDILGVPSHKHYPIATSEKYCQLLE
jgi:hypothetical protein